MDKDETRETHPSYGMIQINRVSCGGGRRLFGSALTDHMSLIRLRIYTNAERRHSHGDDKFWPANARPTVEIEMSPAQYAELLTTMNVGLGVPCTVLHVNGKDVEAPPKVEHETEKVRAGFKQTLTDSVQALVDQRAALATSLDGKVSKKLLADVLRSFDHAIMEIRANAPFYLERFEEATNKVVQTAKAEVDAFVTGVVAATGLKQLQERGASASLLLEGKEAEDDREA